VDDSLAHVKVRGLTPMITDEVRSQASQALT
jgi:hypothetical protein